jgi:hypothetical protein
VIVTDCIDRLSVRLLFTTGDDAFQHAILKATGSNATHAALAVGPDGSQLLHAYEDGVQIDSRERWLGEKAQRVVAEYQIIPDVTDGVYAAMAHVGKRYSVRHVVKIAIMRLFRLVRLGRPEGNDAFTCARFVMTIDPMAQMIPEWRWVSREAVVPRDLMEAAERGESFYRLG